MERKNELKKSLYLIFNCLQAHSPGFRVEKLVLALITFERLRYEESTKLGGKRISARELMEQVYVQT